LALDQGDATTAADLAERFLRGLPAENRLGRPAALEVLALAQVALGAADHAAETGAELQAIAMAVATEPLRAAASFIEGAVAAAHGDHETARRRFEDATDLYTSTGAPFEAARARIELARSLLALGRNQAAGRPARAALEALDQLGALPEQARAVAVLRHIQSEPRERGGTPPAVADLTPRELAVLRLVAAGKSNQAIATELVLSVRTVERHISNIYGKIGASGMVARASATAYALRHGLTHPHLA
jgi:DNA-binding NarL/FixJ family response regulator